MRLDRIADRLDDFGLAPIEIVDEDDDHPAARATIPRSPPSERTSASFFRLMDSALRVLLASLASIRRFAAGRRGRRGGRRAGGDAHRDRRGHLQPARTDRAGVRRPQRIAAAAVGERFCQWSFLGCPAWMRTPVHGEVFVHYGQIYVASGAGGLSSTLQEAFAGQSGVEALSLMRYATGDVVDASGLLEATKPCGTTAAWARHGPARPRRSWASFARRPGLPNFA